METRIKALAFIPCATASLSVIGSFFTLLTIHRSRLTRVRGNSSDDSKGLRTYERLLIGISFFDILFSTSLATGPFLLPASTSMPWAYGTIGTCTFQGVFAQLGMASFCYSLMLMMYYVLVIRYNKSDSWISTWAEPFMHAIPIGFFGSTAIIGIVWQIFNPSGFHCWVGVYPINCPLEVPCERGEEHVRFFGKWLLIVPFFIINGFLVMSLSVISITVWQQHAASQRFVMSANSQRQAKQVVVQCFLYALAFVNSMIWSTMGAILSLFADLEYDDLGKHFWIPVLGVIFFPLQGLFNFMIFIRPRFLKKKRAHACWAVALKEAVWNPSSSLRQGQAQGGKRGSSKWTSTTVSRSRSSFFDFSLGRRNTSETPTPNKSVQTFPPRNEEEKGNQEEEVADPEALEETLRSEQVSGHSLIVENLQEGDSCH